MPRSSAVSEQAPGAGVSRYAPLPGVPDELLGAGGDVRPAWTQFIRHFNALSADDVARRFERGDQYLRDAGVFFRQYGEADAVDRDWPLSHVPVIIGEAEWNEIAQALTQRADLLEAVVADLYGPARLVADGHIPAPLVAMNPEWLRPMVGQTPASGHFLHFVAFEIGRGPDGGWWVLGDRTQAPSGAGFALENRVATARVFSDLYGEANVHRLAGFFRGFRDALQGLRADRDSRVAILTPGIHNDTYFEHAYIARYLGIPLLQGEDLTVQNGRVMVRTVAGLQPVSVLWRRLDASYADPLELDERSRLGTPGLVGVQREGNLTMVNALGSGVLETRALLAFLPRISEVLTGERLKMPNIATWWCGQPVERDYVRRNAARMMIGPALSTRPPFEPDGETIPAETMDAGLLEREGAMLVGQETVSLSTTPAFVDGKLVPRPMTIRVFLARTQKGWTVMPGGYARIGRSDDPAAIAMQRGGSVADVWVVSDKPVAPDTMLPGPSEPYLRTQLGVLPSRAADNLFWLGRYVERAEVIMRLLRAYHLRLAETGSVENDLIAHIRERMGQIDVDPEGNIPEGLIRTVSASIASAGHVRDRFSIDGWMALADLAKTARRMTATVTPGDDCARAMGVLLRKITGFTGLVHENMYRFSGWRFLSIGRALERSIAMAATLAHFTAPDAPEGSLDLAVELGDSVMSHRRRYAVSTNRNTVLDLLALDAMNPRSILYQLGEIKDQGALLPGAVVQGQMSPLSRELLRMHTGLAIRLPEELDEEALQTLVKDLAGLSDLMSETYLR